jgi:ADP-ribose pyrophosphatase YjhB (NUDIX family)
VLELDETFETGVRREIQEETGIPVEAERLTGVYKNMRLGVVVLVFRCRPLAEQPRATEEAEAVCWVSPSEMPGLMVPAFAVRVTDAVDVTTALSRVHDGIRVIGE